MNELFPIQESLSPKLKWMKDNRIRVKHFKEHMEDWEDEFGNEYGPWSAMVIGSEAWESAQTEEEALWKLCKNTGIKFYK